MMNRERIQSAIAWHLPNWLVYWAIVRAAIQTDSSLGVDGLPVWPTLTVRAAKVRFDRSSS